MSLTQRLGKIAILGQPHRQNRGYTQAQLKSIGVGEMSTTGSDTRDIIDYLKMTLKK